MMKQNPIFLPLLLKTGKTQATRNQRNSVSKLEKSHYMNVIYNFLSVDLDRDLQDCSL